MPEKVSFLKGGIALMALWFLLAQPAAAATPSTFDSDGGYTPFGLGRLEANDADNDGLSDADELIFGSSVLGQDSDGDGFDDGLEVRTGFDPMKGGAAKLKKRIVITLATQDLTYSLGPKTVGTFKVSTGRPGRPTPLGTFKINKRGDSK